MLLTGAATTILVARIIAPAGLGAFAVAQTVIAIGLVACTLGAEHGIVYYVSSGRWAPSDAIRSGHYLALSVGGGGAALAIAARLVVPAAFRGLSVADCVIVALAIPAALSWFYSSYVALATDQYASFGLSAAAQSMTALVLVGALCGPAGVTGAVVGLTASHVLVAAARLALDMRSGAWRSGPPGGIRVQTRRALAFGVKGYAANSLQVINYRLDLFILSAATTAAVVGQYSVAVAATGVLWLLPQGLSDVLFPRVAKLHSSNEETDRTALHATELKSLRHTVLLTAAGVVVIIPALELLVVPIYGPSFEESITLGLVLLPGVALLALTNPLAAIIVGRGQPQFMLRLAVIVTPATVILYIVLIPDLHAIGAALASSISYAAAFALALFFYQRLVGGNVATALRPTADDVRDYTKLIRRVARSCSSAQRVP